MCPQGWREAPREAECVGTVAACLTLKTLLAAVCVCEPQPKSVPPVCVCVCVCSSIFWSVRLFV